MTWLDPRHETCGVDCVRAYRNLPMLRFACYDMCRELAAQRQPRDDAIARLVERIKAALEAR